MRSLAAVLVVVCAAGCAGGDGAPTDTTSGAVSMMADVYEDLPVGVQDRLCELEDAARAAVLADADLALPDGSPADVELMASYLLLACAERP